jgi:hypothetical protein
MKSRISENGVSFFGAGGHNHDGVNSSLINTSSYSLFDFSPNYVGAQSRISRQQGNRTAMEDFIVRVVNSQVLSPAGITLEPNTLNGKTITANTITATQIAANTITATQIAANTITANNIAVGTITGTQIANGAIGNSQVNNVMSIINLQSNFVTTNATIQSTVYTAGAGGVGWAINAAGNAEFNNVTVRGTVVSGAGSVGGWTINTSSLASGSTALYSNGQATFGNTTLFSNGRITNGSLIISATGVLDATDAVVRGNIQAGSGSIAGININGNRLFSGVGNWNNSNTPFYLDINGYFSLEDKLSWNPDSNVLSVKGDITGSSGTFSGSLSGASISGGSITGTSVSTISTPFNSSSFTFDQFRFNITDTAKLRAEMRYQCDANGNGALITSYVDINNVTEAVDGAVINVVSSGGGNTHIRAGIINANVSITSPSLNGRVFATTNTGNSTPVHQSASGQALTRATSKRALKYDIEEFNEIGLIDKLTTRTYKWKKPEDFEETEYQKYLRENTIDIGFIAEEVAEIENGRLANFEDDERKTPSFWKYLDIIALLVAEVKDLRKRVASLEDEV